MISNQRSTIITLLIAAIILVTMGIAALLGVGSERHSLEAPSDQELATRVDSQLASAGMLGRALLRMKQSFPTEYGGFRQLVIDAYRRGDDDAQAFQAGQTFMAAFVETNARFVERADPAALSWLANADAAAINALAEDNVEACAQYVELGQVDPKVGLGISARSRAALARQLIAMLDAMASGRAESHAYQPLSDAEWNALQERMRILSDDDSAIDALGTPQFSALNSDQKCNLAVVLYAAILEQAPKDQARYLRELWMEME